MKNNILIIFMMIVVFIVSGFFITQNSTFMPQNDLYKPLGLRAIGGINESEFHLILDRFEEIYTPLVREQGGLLELKRYWESGIVNAQTSRSGDTWTIEVWGGIARHEAVNLDAFTLIMCHEFGHHFGGDPKMGFVFFNWVSVEGQADYYAAVKCFEMLTRHEDSVAIVNDMEIHAIPDNACSETYSDPNEQAMCKRVSMAGYYLGLLLQDAFPKGDSDPFPGYAFWERKKEDKPVSFDTPDNVAVWMTKKTHPTPQCRVDTFFAGALCNKKLSDSSPESGYCKRAEGFKVGVRPRCWFKP